MKSLTQYKNYLTSTIVPQINNEQTHAAIIKSLVKRIDEALDKPPVQQLINLGANKSSIENILAVLILKSSNLLSTSGNLKQGQALDIAIFLIQDYPLHSLDDFGIMLESGVRGRYGEVFRFDISVVYKWMQCYVDEYYAEKEREIKRQKLADATKVKEYTEDESKWIDSLLNSWLHTLDQKKTETSPPKEVVLKKSSYIPDESKVKAHELRLAYAKDNYHPITGQKLDVWMKFEDWIKTKRTDNF